jgi:hypothetical protein
MDPALIEQLFEQGLMGIEIPEEYGGAGMNFTAAIVGIEELARVDPSVSVIVDVHNTLVNMAILKYGTEESKRKWLGWQQILWDPSVCPSLLQAQMPLHYGRKRRRPPRATRSMDLRCG